MSLADAREKLVDWRQHYNEDRPHCAIGYSVPIAVHYPDERAGKIQLPAVQTWGAANGMDMRQLPLDIGQLIKKNC